MDFVDLVDWGVSTKTTRTAFPASGDCCNSPAPGLSSSDAPFLSLRLSRSLSLAAPSALPNFSLSLHVEVAFLELWSQQLAQPQFLGPSAPPMARRA